MELFIVICLLCLLQLVAATLTWLGCRLALRRNRRASWGIAVLGAVCASALFTLCVNGDYLFHPSRWKNSATSFGWVAIGFSAWIAITIIPALLVVRHYRARHIQNEICRR
jgi:hypothetical protein